MAQVKFAKGLKSSFDKLETKDSNIVYILTDTQEIYVGATRVGNVFTQDDISSLDTKVDTIETTLNGAVSDISGLKAKTSTIESSYPISITETAGTGNIATSYTIKQNGKTWTINTIKDKVVSSGKYDAKTQSIILTLNDGNTVSIPVADLIDVYTGVNGTEINVSVSSDNKISASLNNNSIEKSKLSSTVQAMLDKATSSDSQLDWEDF